MQQVRQMVRRGGFDLNTRVLHLMVSRNICRKLPATVLPPENASFHPDTTPMHETLTNADATASRCSPAGEKLESGEPTGEGREKRLEIWSKYVMSRENRHPMNSLSASFGGKIRGVLKRKCECVEGGMWV